MWFICNLTFKPIEGLLRALSQTEQKQRFLLDHIWLNWVEAFMYQPLWLFKPLYFRDHLSSVFWFRLMGFHPTPEAWLKGKQNRQPFFNFSLKSFQELEGLEQNVKHGYSWFLEDECYWLGPAKQPCCHSSSVGWRFLHSFSIAQCSWTQAELISLGLTHLFHYHNLNVSWNNTSSYHFYNFTCSFLANKFY